MEKYKQTQDMVKYSKDGFEDEIPINPYFEYKVFYNKELTKELFISERDFIIANCITCIEQVIVAMENEVSFRDWKNGGDEIDPFIKSISNRRYQQQFIETKQMVNMFVEYLHYCDKQVK